MFYRIVSLYGSDVEIGRRNAKKRNIFKLNFGCPDVFVFFIGVFVRMSVCDHQAPYAK